MECCDYSPLEFHVRDKKKKKNPQYFLTKEIFDNIWSRI